MTDDIQGRIAGPAPSTRRQATMVLVLVFLAGLLIGIAADRVWLRRHWGGRPGRGGPGGPFAEGQGRGVGGPPGIFRGGMPRAMSPEFAAQRRREMVKRLTRELDLTATQQQSIDSIMAGNEAEFQVLEQEMRPRMRAFLMRTRGQIDSVLTPAQREKFHRFGPPDDAPPPPPPPGR
jgi:hypothetical protein